ncbi:magnesium/cobalt transporter CorA [Clostridium aciditolerans]|uniref:Magnesium transport protein CorA n=1 Tax=Clostridium aciditolerans TaxID=339861 RepID=A0A934HW75_9CLOT|nr:magnesium/cobalt transporter CorA [Clostridium aciditolerans]MBI6872469.1 magnesium/cobalt transporter CorA [Clostridium aciditolerans]
MIHTLAITKDMQLKKDLPLNELDGANIKWYWVDFDSSDESESVLLDTHFHFHHLAIEDCLHFLQRPKLDFYDNYNFFVLHALNNDGLTPSEVDLFVGNNFIVSYHKTHLEEIEEVRLKINTTENSWGDGSIYVFYQILDKLVDHYFPAVYRLEDQIDVIDDNVKRASLRKLLDRTFEVRSDLLRLRRIITQMRDLAYRILSSDHLKDIKEKHIYFSDVYDHLLRLTEMIESSLALTSELRDSYLSVNSHKMNKIMMLLTVVTTIFIPLTFIVGVYGMNFKYMPELDLKYGYFIVLGIMLLIGFFMFTWFKRKGWFDID